MFTLYSILFCVLCEFFPNEYVKLSQIHTLFCFIRFFFSMSKDKFCNFLKGNDFFKKAMIFIKTNVVHLLWFKKQVLWSRCVVHILE